MTSWKSENKEVQGRLGLEDCIKLHKMEVEKNLHDQEETELRRAEEHKAGMLMLFERIGLVPDSVWDWDVSIEGKVFRIRKYQGTNYVPEYYLRLVTDEKCPDCGAFLCTKEIHFGRNPAVIGELLDNPNPEKHTGCVEKEEHFAAEPLRPTDEKLIEAFKEWLRGWERSEYND